MNSLIISFASGVSSSPLQAFSCSRLPSPRRLGSVNHLLYPWWRNNGMALWPTAVGLPQAFMHTLSGISNGEVNPQDRERFLRLHTAPKTASTFGPKSKSRLARLGVTSNTVQATGLRYASGSSNSAFRCEQGLRVHFKV
jgi:hypothetical protein